MSQKTTIVLLVALMLAVGIGLAIRFDVLGLGENQKDQKAKEEQRTKDLGRQGKPLLENAPEIKAIVKLTVERPGQPTIVARYQDNRWALVEPAAMKADASPLERLITTFQGLTIAKVYRQDEKNPLPAKRAGLEPPQAVLTMADKTGREYRLAVGGVDPLASGWTFVRVGDDATIYAVDRDVLAQLDVDAQKLRSKGLWDVASDQIKHIEVTSPKGTFTLDKDKNDWTLTMPRDKQGQPPIRTAADSGKVSSLTAALGPLQAAEWVTRTGSGGLTAVQRGVWGLDAPPTKVQFIASTVIPPSTQPQDRTTTVTFGRDMGEDRYGRIDNGEDYFKVSDSSLKGIELEPAELRDKRLAPVNTSDLVGLTLTRAAGAARAVATLIKDAKGAWQMVAPVQGPADGDAVDKLVNKLTSIKVDAFDDNPTAATTQPLENPRVRIALDRGAGRSPVVVLIGPKSQTGATTLVKSGESVARVPTAEVEELIVEPLALADKSVWSLKEDSVKQITRTDSSVKNAALAKRTVARDGFEWKLAEPVKMDADSEAVRTLLTKFATLKARQRTTLTAAAAGLDKTAGAVTLDFTVVETLPAATTQSAAAAATQPAAPKEVTTHRILTLGKKDDVTVYCQADGKGPVFQIDSGLLADATAELARRTLFGKVDSGEKANLLVLESFAGKVELRRIGDDWKLRMDATVVLDPKKVTEVINSVTGMTVTRYADFNCSNRAAYDLDKPTTRVVIGWPGAATTAPDAEPVTNTVTLLVSDKREAGSSFAMIEKDTKVGLVNPAELLKAQKDWKYFEKGKEEKPATPGTPGMPGMPPGGPGAYPGGGPPD